MNRYAGIESKFDVDLQRRVGGFRFKPETDESLLFTVILEDGDTFETLAYKFYGGENLWWVIADQNPLVHPLYLVAGTRIRVLRRGSLPTIRPPVRYGEEE